jgi:thiamine biosynthesis lipoprotein
MFSRLKCVFIGCAALLISATYPANLKEYKLVGLAQGTSYQIKYFASASVIKQTQIDSILNVIDLSMSLYKEHSVISTFNRSAKGTFIDDHFVKVFQKAKVIYQDTKGLFDPTVAPLVQLWGFGPQKIVKFPDSALIITQLACVGMDKIKLNKNFLQKKKACLTIDLNGIAQGYTVDVLADFLKQHGIAYFLVEVGGELRISGPKPDGQPMKIGIEGPTSSQYESATIKHVISVDQGAVTTSGNYAKFLQYGKQKISHLIEPKTGYPIQNEMISVTVYAKDAITADGYDNALMAMPIDKAIAFVDSRPNLAAYFIYKNREGKVVDTLSSRFKKLILN